MDEYYFGKRHVPAFGSWECDNNGDDDFGFTECFETARQAAGLFRYSYSEERDLYVAGDLYDNHILTPAMIVVPRHCHLNDQKKKKKKGVDEDDEKKDDSAWVVSDCPPSRKAVDEDLYKISPDLLRAHTKKQKKRRRSWCSLFSCCLQPTCVH